jgi:MoaA/NifB/PqqE/SkfB family radical SAM enzyme
VRALSTEAMLAREAVANRPRHWVRLVTACNSRCVFCLDSDTPRNVFLPVEEIEAELRRGREQLGAWKVIVSGGEASLHPKFAEIVATARALGYGRIQTVTNGWRYAERDFFEAAVDAGLDEITFSLHGHGEALHDHMTGHKGAFRRIVKAIARSIRSKRVITSIDVCINKQNVGVLDKIVELGFSLGVTEYDLLHVIPQAAAYENRDTLFYDPREHLPMLRKVFGLNRHPSFVIWTNRFPVSYLEGLEDLIQDPHKMLDEVNGRRFQVRRYLDVGDALDCRQPERCVHCFIEPFCTTMDRVVEKQRESRFEVWDVGSEAHDGSALPFGATLLGVEVERLDQVTTIARPEGAGLFVRTSDAVALEAQQARTVLVAATSAQLSRWLAAPLPENVALDVVLSRETAGAIAASASVLASLGERVRIVQPAHEHMATALEHDVRDPRAFFASLAPLRLRVSGLPACLAPGMELLHERAIAARSMFDSETGRLDIKALARHHVASEYRGKSVRCADCRVTARCDGAHINMIRDQGLAILTPLVEGAEADAACAQVARLHPEPISRLANGRPVEARAPSLPGHAMPEGSVPDPLALIAREQLLRKAKRDAFLGRTPGAT